METTEKVLNSLEQSKSSRRSALMMGGAALAGLALSRVASAQAPAIMDSDILNFALNLEFLEANYYTLATAGVTIDKLPTNPLSIKGGDGSAGGTVSVKTSPMVPFNPTGPLLQYATETATEERNHVSFLQSALAAKAVAQPNLDLMASFNMLAQVAGLPTPFDPFASEANFLLGAFIFEDVGVTAYHGAAGLITTPAYLAAAAGILAVEAYHAGSIRTQIYKAGSTAQDASNKIAATRAALSAMAATTPPVNPDDFGVTTLPSGASTVVDADANAIAFSRTTAQVLSIVYGGKAPGVFFPQGMNGTIK